MLKWRAGWLLGFLTVGASAVFGQAPDPRDSVILESKTVYGGAHSGDSTDTAAYVYVKVYISNKDTLSALTLALQERRVAGIFFQYMTLARPRNFDGVVNRLTNTLGVTLAADFSTYNSSSPDSFLLSSGFNSFEPPNAIRKAFWELKFDTVVAELNRAAVIEIDSATYRTGKACGFTTAGGVEIPVNFLKSTITIAAPVADPRDSVILESKTIVPGLTGSPAFVVKVSITNKDSLSFLTLVLAEQSIAGSAYVLLASPRTFAGVVTTLTNSLRYFSAAGFVAYNDVSPDSFILAAGFDPSQRDETLEPPNAVRKPIWELKFKHASDSVGQVILRAINGSFAGQVIAFTDALPKDMPVNLLPGFITIDFAKGDLNRDKAVGPADVVLILNAVMLGVAPPRGLLACDLNCDNQRTIADVMLLLNAAFLAEGFPC